MLRVEGLTVAYGAAVAVRDLSFEAAAGSALALLGRNGAGKSSTLRALAGHLPLRGGRIALEGAQIASLPAWRRARRGLGHVPESRGPLPSLSVEEQLLLAADAPQSRPAAAPFDLGAAYALFPRLAERRRVGGGQLSGGEQQMLAIARALMRRPRLLLLDEPTEGLAPTVAEELAAALTGLRAPDRAIVIAAPRPGLARRFADQALLLSKGEAVWRGEMDALLADPDLTERWLGAAAAPARRA